MEMSGVAALHCITPREGDFQEDVEAGRQANESPPPPDAQGHEISIRLSALLSQATCGIQSPAVASD